MRGPTVSARGFCRPGSLVPVVQMLSPGPVPPFGTESAPGEELPQERHADENGCELLCFCRLAAAVLLSRHTLKRLRGEGEGGGPSLCIHLQLRGSVAEAPLPETRFPQQQVLGPPWGWMKGPVLAFLSHPDRRHRSCRF